MALQDDQSANQRPAGADDSQEPEAFNLPPEDMLKRLIERLEGTGQLKAVDESVNDTPTQDARTDAEDDPEKSAHSVVLSKTPLPSELEELLPIRRPEQTPWTLQQFFDGQIDLDVELAKRFPSIPTMASIRFRTLGAESSRRVALLATQDGSATVTVDADQKTKVVQLSFTFGSMLTLRFVLDTLNDVDRARWLELMRREQGGMAFLWGPRRWEDEYLICVSRNAFTTMYAFSPHNFEAAVRLTPTVTDKYLDWLEENWQETPDEDDDDGPLLTW